MILWAVRQLVMWGVVAMLLYSVVGSRLLTLVPREGHLLPPPATMPSPGVVPANLPPPPGGVPTAPAGTVWNGDGSAMVFHANAQGHVYLQAFVDNTPTHFIVDTGATMVALTRRDAQAAGIDNGRLVYSGMVSTANGLARVAPVRLRELRIGQNTMTEVDAMVVDNLNISLLGQSYLRRLASYEMRDGILTLNWR